MPPPGAAPRDEAIRKSPLNKQIRASSPMLGGGKPRTLLLAQPVDDLLLQPGRRGLAHAWPA
jgi:hypothetical protein